MSATVIVKIGEVKLARDDGVLVSYALGSCVGVCMTDSVNRVAALAHVLLPAREGTADGDCKYADAAIKHMYDLMLKNGASRKNIEAKICGGARMFPLGISDERFAIGERNIASVTEELNKLKVHIVESQTGGTIARSVSLSAKDGKMTVTSRNSAAASRLP